MSQSHLSSYELTDQLATYQRSSYNHPEIFRLVNYNKRLINRWNELKSLIEDNQVELSSEDRMKYCKEIEFLTNLIIQQEGIIRISMRDQYSAENIPENNVPVFVTGWAPRQSSGVESVIGYKQIKLHGNKYNYRHCRKDGVFVYRCNKYRDLRCPSQILLDSKNNIDMNIIMQQERKQINH
jgi:hypothetical protein